MRAPRSTTPAPAVSPTRRSQLPRTPNTPLTLPHNSLAPTLDRWGPRTTELRNNACYNFSNRAQCNWNGGVWPYETCKAGTALVNLLQLYPAQARAVHAAVCSVQ